MQSVDELSQSTVFAGLAPAGLEFLAGCASTVSFQPGEHVFREGESARTFYLVRSGSVALESYVPPDGPVTIDVVGEGEVLGWSWLFPPYHWHFDARALGLVEATAFDGEQIRAQCQADPQFGLVLIMRFAAVMLERLQSTRLRLLALSGQRRP